MANQNGRPIAPARKLVAAVLGTIAVFVMVFGLGLSSWAIVVLGLAVLALSIALGMVNVVRRGARAWISGTAQVKAVSDPPVSSAYGRAELQLVVIAPGLPITEVLVRDPRVPVDKWPRPGETLPIRVDVDDMRRVRIDWLNAPDRADPPPPGQSYVDTTYTEPLDEYDDDLLGEPEPPPWAAASGSQWDREEPPPPPPPAEPEEIVVHDTPGGPVVEGRLVEHDDTPPLPRRAGAGPIPTQADQPRPAGARPSPRPRAGAHTAPAGATTATVEPETAPQAEWSDSRGTGSASPEAAAPPATAADPPAPEQRPAPDDTVEPAPTATDEPAAPAPAPTAPAAAGATAAGSTAAGSTAAGSTAAGSTAAGSTAAGSTAAGSTAADSAPENETRPGAESESRAPTESEPRAAAESESQSGASQAASGSGSTAGAASTGVTRPDDDIDLPLDEIDLPLDENPDTPPEDTPAAKPAVAHGLVTPPPAVVPRFVPPPREKPAPPAETAAATAETTATGPEPAAPVAEPIVPAQAAPPPAQSTEPVITGVDTAPEPPAAETTTAETPTAETPAAETSGSPWADLEGGYEPDERADDMATAYPSARPGPAGAIHGVGLTVLVTDLDRSIRFYRDTLGFYEIDKGEGNAVLASGDTRLVLRTVNSLAAAGRLIYLNLEVGDVQAMYQELTGKGVTFEHPPQVVNHGQKLELWSATFHDPDGHNIAITQWRATR